MKILLSAPLLMMASLINNASADCPQSIERAAFKPFFENMNTHITLDGKHYKLHTPAQDINNIPTYEPKILSKKIKINEQLTQDLQRDNPRLCGYTYRGMGRFLSRQKFTFVLEEVRAAQVPVAEMPGSQGNSQPQPGGRQSQHQLAPYNHPVANPIPNEPVEQNIPPVVHPNVNDSHKPEMVAPPAPPAPPPPMTPPPAHNPGKNGGDFQAELNNNKPILRPTPEHQRAGRNEDDLMNHFREQIERKNNRMNYNENGDDVDESDNVWD